MRLLLELLSFRQQYYNQPHTLTKQMLSFGLVGVLLFGNPAVPTQANSKPPPNPRVTDARTAVTIVGTPLHIAITQDLANALYVEGKSQFFDDFDSGTFLQVDGNVYGSKPTGSASFFTPFPFNPVSNTGPLGTGTRNDPYEIISVVDAGETGLRLIQTISYVNEELSYNTSFTIQNFSVDPKSVRLFQAADLYLDVPGNTPDFGIGYRDSRSGAIGAMSRDRRNVQVLLPNISTRPDAYQESAVDGAKPFWAFLGDANGKPGSGFNNTVDKTFHDAAAGLQWNKTLAPGTTITINTRTAIGTASLVLPRPSTSKIAVIQRTNPNMISKRNGIVTHTIVVKNYGQGSAKNVVISMPFDFTKVQLLDAQFSRPAVWVSKILSNSLELQTGNLSQGGDIVTGTVRLLTLPTAPSGTALGTRLSYIWFDAAGVGEGFSNLPSLVAGEQDINAPLFDLKVSSLSDERERKYHFNSTSFAPDEPVALWVNKPDGTVEEVGSVTASMEGQIDIDFDAVKLPIGRYTMVAYGLWTEFTAVAGFSIK